MSDATVTALRNVEQRVLKLRQAEEAEIDARRGAITHMMGLGFQGESYSTEDQTHATIALHVAVGRKSLLDELAEFLADEATRALRG